MRPVKDSARALVRISYDGKVYKTFRGRIAKERYENEIRVLKYLEAKGCAFVPVLLEQDDETLSIVTSNCGQRVERLGEERRKLLFDELEAFGVRHDDAEVRNVTYRATDGRFCLIDFEFATILEHPELGPPKPDPDP